MHNEFTAILEKAEEGGYVAFCAEVPEANGQGETEETAIENLRSSIAFVLQFKRDESLKEIAAHAVQRVVTVE